MIKFLLHVTAAATGSGLSCHVCSGSDYLCGDINDGGISSVNWVTVDASGPDVEPTEEERREHKLDIFLIESGVAHV